MSTLVAVPRGAIFWDAPFGVPADTYTEEQWRKHSKILRMHGRWSLRELEDIADVYVGRGAGRRGERKARWLAWCPAMTDEQRAALGWEKR